MLESYYHEKACFVTLTYDDAHLPLSDSGLPILKKCDCQLWLKRLRFHFSGTEIRYYLAGEYGTKGKRPHYHAIIFGLGPEQLDPDYFVYGGKSGGTTGVEKRNTPLSRLWSKGLVHVGEVTRESIQYVAGYVTKKFTKKGDGYEPEFALMSRKPGIGARAVDEISATLQQYNLQEKTKRQLRIDGKTWPLGRYLQAKLSDSLGITFGTEQYVAEMSRIWVDSNRRNQDFLHFLVSLDDGRYAKIEARDKIYNRRNSL